MKNTKTKNRWGKSQKVHKNSQMGTSSVPYSEKYFVEQITFKYSMEWESKGVTDGENGEGWSGGKTNGKLGEWQALVAPTIFILGAVTQGVWRTEVPSGVQGLSPGRGFGGRSPPEAKTVCRHRLEILTAETIKIWKFHTIRLPILDRYVSRWGLSDPFWA